MRDNSTATGLINEMNVPIDTDFASHRLMETNNYMESISSASSNTVIGLIPSKGKMKQINETTRSREELWNFDQPPCQKTSHTTYSEGSSVGQCLDLVYKELAEHRMLLTQIQETVKIRDNNQNREITNTLAKLHTPEDDSLTSERGTAGALTVFQFEGLSDCESQTTENDFYSACDELPRPCSPSPAGYLELWSSFCPEQFTVDGLFGDPFFVLSAKRSTTCSWTREYCILYAETPRQWRRLTVSANFEGLTDQVFLFDVDTSHENDHHSVALPPVVEDYVNRQLSCIDQFSSVTCLALYFERNESGLVSSDPARTKISENYIEACSSGENQMLCDIEDLGCKQFLESEIITQSRRSASCFIVRVESQTCIERKAPFVSSGIRGENGIQCFFDELKLLKSLRGCNGVAGFIGVVLDDARKHLMSYLYEYPALGNLTTLFEGAKSRSEIIPWDIREGWARQIVTTVAEIHSGRGSLVGSLFWDSDIGVRVDGTIAFTNIRSSQKHFGHRRGGMAPELRGLSSTDVSTLVKKVNFRTEVFQLGLLLWMLAEHKTNTDGCFCPRSACTIRPQYTCTLDHADPVELPSCNAAIPPYFNDLIKQSRLSDPKKRKTARQLQQMFPPSFKGNDDNIIVSTSGIDLLKRYARADTFAVHCDECGSRDMSISYHCNQCSEGEFDLCRQCFSQGIPCLDPQHRLMKRMQTDQRTFKDIPQ